MRVQRRGAPSAGSVTADGRPEAERTPPSGHGVVPSATGGTNPRWGRYGSRPVWLLATVAFVDAVDKGILPGVLTKVQDDLGFSDSAAGLLGTAFILMGFIVALPAGYLADRYHRTRIIAVVLASWGVISALNGLVRNYWQFFIVRSTLGMADTIDNPASQSLIADYYPPSVRGRAYALQRVAPIVGTAAGTGLGGLVGALFGWRWAFVAVGVPGSLLALAIWRLPEPRRGENDVEPSVLGDEAPLALDIDLSDVEALPTPATRDGFRALWEDVKRALQVRTLRALMTGSAIAAGATGGIGFWAPAFYERHTTLSSGQAAGVTAGLILLGALCGTWAGGVVTDRLRQRDESAPMLVAGVAQFCGASLLMITFLPVPLVIRMGGQALGVALLVGGYPGLTAMISEVVPSSIRGISFSVNSFLAALASAASPVTIGFLADRFPITVDGEVKGHIANAFLCVTPLVLVGALVVLRGRRHVAGDRARVIAEASHTGDEPVPGGAP